MYNVFQGIEDGLVLALGSSTKAMFTRLATRASDH